MPALSAELDSALLEAVTAQLKLRAVRIKSGTMLDATVIASASEGDDEARGDQDDEPSWSSS